MYLTEKTRKIYEDKLQELKQRKIELSKEKHKIFKDEDGFVERHYVISSIVHEMQFVDNQIAETEKILREATMVERQSNKDDTVDIGDRVTVLYAEDEEPRTFTLTTTFTKPGDVSISSPLGKSVYLKKLGDVVEYVVKQKKYTAKIVGLQNMQEIAEESQPNT